MKYIVVTNWKRPVHIIEIKDKSECNKKYINSCFPLKQKAMILRLIEIRYYISKMTSIYEYINIIKSLLLFTKIGTKAELLKLEDKINKNSPLPPHKHHLIKTLINIFSDK